MIDLYTWSTPNGHKVQIMLEECGLPYQAHPINIGTGDQFTPEFLKISPNNKIPALVDSQGPDGKPISIFESGAILIYLAAKTGKFMPKSDRNKYDVLQWLMFQMGGLGPMLGQAHHFRKYAPDQIEYAVNRYTNEAKRLYGVMDKHLATRSYFVAEKYSIADIAIYPWVNRWEWQGIEWANYPHLRKWYDAISARPAVQSGLKVLSDLRKPLTDDKAREAMFGASQYKSR